jgi:hypothetical protein
MNIYEQHPSLWIEEEKHALCRVVINKPLTNRHSTDTLLYSAVKKRSISHHIRWRYNADRFTFISLTYFSRCTTFHKTPDPFYLIKTIELATQLAQKEMKRRKWKRMKKQTKNKDIALALHPTLSNQPWHFYPLSSVSLSSLRWSAISVELSATLSLCVCVCDRKRVIESFFDEKKWEYLNDLEISEKRIKSKGRQEKTRQEKERKKEKTCLCVWRDAMTGVNDTHWDEHCRCRHSGTDI